MEGYITDAENLKKTFIKSLSTYLKVSISDLAPRKGAADEKPVPQAVVPAPTLILKKPRNVPDSSSDGPYRSHLPTDSVSVPAVTVQTSSASTSGSGSSSAGSVKSSLPAQTIQTGSSAFSSVALDRKTAKYCRETFKDLLVQVPHHITHTTYHTTLTSHSLLPRPYPYQYLTLFLSLPFPILVFDFLLLFSPPCL